MENFALLENLKYNINARTNGCNPSPLIHLLRKHAIDTFFHNLVEKEIGKIANNAVKYLSAFLRKCIERKWHNYEKTSKWKGCWDSSRYCEWKRLTEFICWDSQYPCNSINLLHLLFTVLVLKRILLRIPKYSYTRRIKRLQ